jgi:hypothetical protein
MNDGLTRALGDAGPAVGAFLGIDAGQVVLGGDGFGLTDLLAGPAGNASHLADLAHLGGTIMGATLDDHPTRLGDEGNDLSGTSRYAFSTGDTPLLIDDGEAIFSHADCSEGTYRNTISHS